MPRLIETFIDNNGHAFLLSHNREFLEEIGNAILKYAKNTYCVTPNGEIVIQAFDSEQIRLNNNQPFPDELERLDDYLLALTDKNTDLDLSKFYAKGEILHQCSVYYKKSNQILDQHYAYALNLDFILPTAVKTIFNLSHRYERSHVTNRLNCHGSALIASGIFPMANYYEEHIREEDLANGIHAIAFEKREPGDIITLVHYDHSMVYLTDDLCISTNNRCATMGIYTIKEVISIYIPKLQYNSLTDLLGISRFYRKTASVQYSDSLINMVREIYLLELSLCHVFSIQQVVEDKLNVLARSFMLECLSTNVLKRWYRKFQFYTYDTNLTEVITNIRHAQENYDITNEQAKAILEKPAIWKNMAAISTEQGKKALKEGRITINDVITIENTDQFAKKIQPLIFSNTLKQTFFTLANTGELMNKRQSCHAIPYFITKLCAATIGLFIIYKFYSMSINTTDSQSECTNTI